MAPRNILITGANHSVGFSLVKEVLKCSEVHHLFGAATRPSEVSSSSVPLGFLPVQSLRKIQDSRFHYLEMTVTSDESIRDAYEKVWAPQSLSDCPLLQVKDILGDDGLNLLINDHGVMMEYYFDERPGRQSFLRQLDINTASVLVITQIFLPLIEIAARNCPSSELSVDRAAVINVSSTLGSTENNNGEWKNKNMMIFKASKVGQSVSLNGVF